MQQDPCPVFYKAYTHHFLPAAAFIDSAAALGSHLTKICRTHLTEILSLSHIKHLSEGKSGPLEDVEETECLICLDVLGFGSVSDAEELT